MEGQPQNIMRPPARLARRRQRNSLSSGTTTARKSRRSWSIR